jgi:hypothetical protein
MEVGISIGCSVEAFVIKLTKILQRSGVVIAEVAAVDGGGSGWHGQDQDPDR